VRALCHRLFFGLAEVEDVVPAEPEGLLGFRGQDGRRYPIPAVLPLLLPLLLLDRFPGDWQQLGLADDIGPQPQVLLAEIAVDRLDVHILE
jgi:hypothetical protein